MNIDELIKELEHARFIASIGDIDWLEVPDDEPPWLSVDKIWVIGPNDAEGLDAVDMEAIAIRHNTAGEVIRRLKWLKSKDELNVECAKAYSACFAKIEEVIRGVHFDPDAGELVVVRTSELMALHAQLGGLTPTQPPNPDEETA